MVSPAIQYAVLKFTYYWCFAHVQLKLWNCKICKIFLLLGNLCFQVVTVLVKILLLLSVSHTLETFHTSSVTRFLTACYVSLEDLKVFRSYRPFCCWNMVFHDLSWRFSDYDFKINEAADFIVSWLLFHMSISITAKFFVC